MAPVVSGALFRPIRLEQEEEREERDKRDPEKGKEEGSFPGKRPNPVDRLDPIRGRVGKGRGGIPTGKAGKSPIRFEHLVRPIRFEQVGKGASFEAPILEPVLSEDRGFLRSRSPSNLRKDSGSDSLND